MAKNEVKAADAAAPKNNDSDGTEQSNPWPVPKFHFKVTFGNIGVIDFQEVSGLDSEHDVIEYRAGTWQPWSVVKQPGLRKFTDVTFKKGMFKADTTLFDYFMSVTMNVIERQQVTIELLDEEGKTLFIWTLKNAWPMKVSSTDLNAQASEISIEEITLAHEGLSMAKGS